MGHRPHPRGADAAKRLKVIVVPKLGLADGINAVRTIPRLCDFDPGPTADGLKALKNYRKEWDEERSVWREHPRHGWASHAADGFRTMACRYRDAMPPRKKEKPPPRDAWAEDDNAAVSWKVVSDGMPLLRRAQVLWPFLRLIAPTHTWSGHSMTTTPRLLATSMTSPR